MNERSIGIGGGVIFWKIGAATDKEISQDGLRDLGLSQFCPVERSHNSCIRAALAEVFEETSKDERYVVRPIKEGFVVANEHHKDDVTAGDKWADVVAKVTIEADLSISLTPYDYSRLTELLERMRQAGLSYSATSVSQSLIKLIEHLGGVALRPNGGVYWLNDEHLDTWAEIAQVFEKAGADNMLHVLKVVADEQMVRAVGDALQTEILQDVAKITQEIAGDVTETGCLRKLEKANQMLQKVRRYEQAFAAPLSALTTAIADLGGQIAMASLQAAAAV